MRTFLSWSGVRSKVVAEALKDWLRDLFYPEIQPWLSSVDITAGARWEQELATALAESNLGILCITEESLRSPWLLFEAGALGKSLTAAALVPYLIELSPGALPPPLQQFQTVEATRDGTLRLAQTVNGQLQETRRDRRDLERHFDQWWPRLEAVLTRLPPSDPQQPTPGMPDLPAEFTQSFLARREGIGHKQEDLLRVLLRYTREPNDSIEQSALLNEIRRRHPDVTGSELYYRLEQLRLLGFITKELIPESKSYRYRLSSAYRLERGKTGLTRGR
jgi:TIR domain